MNNYRVLELDPIEDKLEDMDMNFYEALDELEEALKEDGYDFYIAPDPYAGQLINLIVPVKYVNGTSTQLEELCAQYGVEFVIK